MATDAFLRPDLSRLQKIFGVTLIAACLIGYFNADKVVRFAAEHSGSPVIIETTPVAPAPAVKSALTNAAPSWAGALAKPASPPKSQASRTAVIEGDDEHGSGTYLGNGYYLTANHVVDGEKTITAKTDDGKSYPASVLWQSKPYDIALIRIAARPAETAASLDCAPLAAGQSLHFEGNPFKFRFVRTYGHVASIEPDAAEKVSSLLADGAHLPWKEMVLVDATVLPGMSGGGAFNEAEHLVGVNVGVAVYSGDDTGSSSLTGLGMIVPASTVCKLLGKGAF